ncbi:MAG: thiamine phosphate synthase [Chloroflexi bacterium]|nr:thiamine phosphate synthase [Chloroflexota bacterium]
MRSVAAVPTPCLCLVTDRKLCSDGSLAERVAAAVAGGVDMVQLRERDLPGGELMELALTLRSITRNKALLVVNDRLDVALAAGADGLHLPEDSLAVRYARQVVPPRFLVGKSVHNVESAQRAATEGASYLVLGTIFPTSSKPGAATGGPSRVSEVAKKVVCPVLAIGGVDSGNVASVIGADAHGVAVISAILGAPDPEGAARELKGAMIAAWEAERAMHPQQEVADRRR